MLALFSSKKEHGVGVKTLRMVFPYVQTFRKQGFTKGDALEYLEYYQVAWEEQTKLSGASPSSDMLFEAPPTVLKSALKMIFGVLCLGSACRVGLFLSLLQRIQIGIY